MASLQKRSSGLYLLSFRYQGHQYQRSLDTSDSSEASRIKKNVESRLKHLADRLLQLSDGASPDDLWGVLLHGRVPTVAAQLITPIRLAAAAEAYLNSYPTGTKEQETLKTERVHLNNFERILGTSLALHTITPGDLRKYINKRLSEKGNRGGTIKPDTVRKELQTFQLVWKFAKRNGHVSAECPLESVKRPKRRQKPPFQTWEQITSAVARGGLSDEQIAELWDGLYLRESEVAELLAHIKAVSGSLARFPYIYPAICFCAYTGARRSEMFRSRIEDVADGWITIQEKKRNRDTRFSHRMVPLNPELALVLEAWLERHPGGRFLFCKNHGEPLDDRTSREAFEAVTSDSKWKHLRGYHILRHSFASILARSGRVSQAEIDDLMGHQTEEMRDRYRHLFPEDKRRAIHSLSYGVDRSA